MAYDVTSNQRRARLAALLATWGDRIQRSVFECQLSADDFQELESRIAATIEPNRDVVQFFRQCAACVDDRVGVGQVHEPSDDPYWIV